jgi:phosphatidylglycerophosphate synthase
VRSFHTNLFWGLTAQALLLCLLAVTVGLTAAGWVVGLSCGVVTVAALRRGLMLAGAHAPGPADQVTLLRAILVGGVASLAADPVRSAASGAVLVTVSAIALVLDGLDGWVARRTGTSSAVGARFDMEVDAFLILVLCVYVAPVNGWWVLTLGLARYAFVAAGWLLPWLRPTLPPRYWRKVVAVAQGVVLTVVAAGVLPRNVEQAALIVALVLLTESFGRDIWWLWRRRSPSAHRTADSVGLAVVAFLLVWFALLAPNQVERLGPSAFLRIPLELVIVIVVGLLLPPTAARVVAVLGGLALGLLTVVSLLDMGFFIAFGRAFNPVYDWNYAASAVDLLSLSIGRREAIVALVATGLLVVVILICLPLAMLVLVATVNRHRTGSIRVATAMGIGWILCAATTLTLSAGLPVASASAIDLTVTHVRQVADGVQDQKTFTEAAAVDPLRALPGDRLLAGLRGKDVIVAFVESYGRVAVQGSQFSSRIDALLDTGTRRLTAAGFSSRSAFLTSPTFGGLSWLAHSTFQSGLRVDNQQRYDDLVSTERMTLSTAFARAGWRTVADVPSNERDWPEGRSFYHYDKVYDELNVGYRGPRFSYAAMPDQYILSAFRRRELAATERSPVMAEIDLVSSHTPWTPLPRMVAWSDVGDGSIYLTQPSDGPAREVLWRDADQVRAAYGRSIEYSLSSVISFVEEYGNDNLVLIVLGDHQPATIVSGPGASHDVPITIIARDPTVMASIDGWAWQDGMRPTTSAPVWPMESFRDRFLAAFDEQPRG